MSATQASDRRLARLEERRHADHHPVDLRSMASTRLHGVLDAAVRGPLTLGQLVGVARRAQAATAGANERDLLDALSASDLATVQMTAINFVLLALARVAGVQAATRATDQAPDAATLHRATQAMRTAADTLAARLHALPDAAALEAMGDQLLGGPPSAADLAVIRAIPGSHLRAHSTGRHFALFADYRQLDL